jgi:predicted PhzF superfamily epimerase YddE/YHI9
MRYHHVDVFTRTPLAGNGLVVYPDARGCTAETMLALTREMKQFESIFLEPTGDSSRHRARIFTVEEELGFAGHPILGAAGVLHELGARGMQWASWTLELQGGREVRVESRAYDGWIEAQMDQGKPTFGPELDPADRRTVARALGLELVELDDLPVQVASTGLPYLIVPVRSLTRPRIVGGFGDLLARFGAKFAYVIDAAAPEGRSWDNAGLAEDPATGSAAGPAAAYLVLHGKASADQEIRVRQGRFVGRPSEIRVRVEKTAEGIVGVRVLGDVAAVARGEIDGRARA